ncbi:MAG: GNAT family N-acetyltransferase, partial [Deltaproteobacteria bacterium]|nr:GNAT family N-acetyltransferase [Deltaproteobacteria bacterium]
PRAAAAEHADQLFAGLQDPALYRFIAEAPPTDVEALRARYTRLATRRSPDGRQAWLNWAIWSFAEEAYVGYVQATVEAGEADIAYVVFQDYWGRGYARKAVAEMMGLLREAHGVAGFRATVDTRNHRSRALLEALGFECVAIHADAEVIHGRSPTRPSIG